MELKEETYGTKRKTEFNDWTKNYWNQNGIARITGPPTIPKSLGFPEPKVGFGRATVNYLICTSLYL